eukprot:CAMPEP_0172720534 /NCGR_PEP_ID=MMETSP1074-20121228/77110_1 /TAXON_ID=2916 /ORGANISM="Ceratium fusus, Strain PA161109" /LENGTH=174 /DNA_ID=CAMNT_0013546067 /DNA_START=151 /DNA_END=675 /DNA_ORIENTATION=+
MRIPDTYDLDLRKVAQKNLHKVDLLTDAAQHATSVVADGRQKKQSVKSTAPPPAANQSEELPMLPPREESKAEVRARHGQRRGKNPEATLINSLRHMGEKGEEAVVCVTTCRFGDTMRHAWRECLERCVENPLMRSTFLTMLPEDDHKAHATTVEMPKILRDKLEHRRQRSAEL